MLNQTIIRVGIRYGVLCSLACFALVLVLYFVGYNPFGEMGRLTYLPIPVFIFLAIRYFKLFNEGNISFGKGFRVGLSVAFYTALATAMLVLVFIYLVGPEVMQNHIQEMKVLLEQTREEQVRLLGERLYEEGYKALDSITPSMLAADDFVRRIFVGGIFSLIAAVFFRK
jgi:heme exporter protein D